MCLRPMLAKCTLAYVARLGGEECVCCSCGHDASTCAQAKPSCTLPSYCTLVALQGASAGTCLDIELVGARGRSSGRLRLAPAGACPAPFQRVTCDRFQVLQGRHPR